MEKDNFISYLAMGQDAFSCEFNVSNEEQIEVIVEDTILEYLNDYTIEKFNEKTKIVKFKKKLGSTLHPKLLILKRNPTIKRETDFKDDSHIKASLLNLEFDNVVDNQIFLRDYLDKLAEGFEIKKVDQGEGGGETDPDPDPEKPTGIIDPRNWKEEVFTIELNNDFELDGVCEVPVEDPKPFSHNVYFIYATDPSIYPDEYIYKIINDKEIKEPCSITLYIDKRACFFKEGETIRKKLYSLFNIGGVSSEYFALYSNFNNVFYEGGVTGLQIKKRYLDIYNSLEIQKEDYFIIARMYHLDPLRGY